VGPIEGLRPKEGDEVSKTITVLVSAMSTMLRGMNTIGVRGMKLKKKRRKRERTPSGRKK